MDISDVIGKLREQQLRQSLHLQALQSTVDTLERFTWNLVRLIAEGTDVVITFEDEGPTPKEAPDGDPTLF